MSSITSTRTTHVEGAYAPKLSALREAAKRFKADIGGWSDELEASWLALRAAITAAEAEHEQLERHKAMLLTDRTALEAKLERSQWREGALREAGDRLAAALREAPRLVMPYTTNAPWPECADAALAAWEALK